MKKYEYKRGGSKKRTPKYGTGGSMKEVPAGKKFNGLRGIPTSVRNKMGYAKAGKEMGKYYTYGGATMSYGKDMPVLKHGGGVCKTYGALPMKKK